jgi:dihydropteroate synthase
MKRTSTIRRNVAEQKVVLEQLRKIPIVQIACERANIGRTTFYRWRKDDAKFKKAAEEAMQDGVDMINDLSESQLIALIKEKNFPAIQLWLRQHHPAYSNRLEVKAKIESEDPLTPEQEALIKEALGIKDVITENNEEA